jgi:hypothetical protein
VMRELGNVGNRNRESGIGNRNDRIKGSEPLKAEFQGL